jgi:hypothetical protein
MDKEEEIKRFFTKHFYWVEDYPVNVERPPPIDWEAFMRELKHCPEIASHRTGISNFSPLFYVILADNVPTEAVQMLLEMNEDAINETEDHWGWHIYHWMQWADLKNISSDILRLFLERTSGDLICEENAFFESPLEFFLGLGQNSLTRSESLWNTAEVQLRLFSIHSSAGTPA